MPKMIIIECSDEEADRMVEQLKNMIAEYEYHPYHGPGKVYEFGSLRIDQPKQEVTLNGVMVDLTRREFEILGLLAEHPNQALPADFLHNAVWSHPDADHGEEEVAAYDTTVTLQLINRKIFNLYWRDIKCNLNHL